MSLRQRITLVPASRAWLNQQAIEHHYMHRAVHYRSNPFGYAVEFDGARLCADNKPAGFIIFASIHFTRQRDLFGYPGLPTQWQVLSLARLWLHDDLPRNSETVVIAKAIRPRGIERISRAGADWLRVHPPRFPDEPYHIRLIVSYADRTIGHEGTIYKASNFRHIKDTVSQKRHSNTRGEEMQGNTLAQYVYHLPEPKVTIDQLPGQLFIPFFDDYHTGIGA